MLETLTVKYNQFLEQLKNDKFFAALKLCFYKCEEVISVEKDLVGLKQVNEKFKEKDLQLLELNSENLNSIDLCYPLKSRYQRSIKFLKDGYKSFVLIRNNKVVADIWYVARLSSKNKIAHVHLKWFEITLEPEDVYLFDMYVTPSERGNSISTEFLGSVLSRLSDKGFKKAYGYFVVDNIPALWVHRLLGYKEISRFIVRRYFLLETSNRKL